MKKTFCIIYMSFVVLLFAANCISFAQDESYGKWGEYGSTPVNILNKVVGGANNDSQIQETALDGVTDKLGAYSSEYKIANTLTYIRLRIYPYLQWFLYIGLVVATILIIYNGLLMTTNVLHKKGDITKIKKNLSYISIGVILMTGFYFFVKVIVAIITAIFGDWSGSSGF